MDHKLMKAAIEIAYKINISKSMTVITNQMTHKCRIFKTRFQCKNLKSIFETRAISVLKCEIVF